MNSAGFEQFGSAESLADYLIAQAVEQYGYLFGTDARFDPVPEIVPAPEPTDGDTNNQVDGVDEADLIETDGEFIYQVNGQTLTVVDASDPASLEIASQVRIPAPWLLNSETESMPTEEPAFRFGGPAGGWSNIDGIYLQDDRLTVISSGYAPGESFPIFPVPIVEPLPPGTEPAPIAEPAFDIYFEPGQPQVQVSVIDVSNPAALNILESSVIEGNLVSSRAVGDDVYVVTSSGFQLPVPEITEAGFYETEAAYLARVQDQILDLALPNIEVRNQPGDPVSEGLLADPSTVYTPFTDSQFQQLTTVSTFDVGDDNLGIDSAVGVVTESVDDIYSSAENLYLLRRDYGNFESNAGPNTEIFKVGLESAELLAKGEVPGTFDNQFSADEYEGFFRISTTTNAFTEESLNNVFVLEQDGRDLMLAGSVEGLAPGERIFSTRFQEDYGFMVTFRQVDPLFTLDLSDARSPQVAGELKLPGFSEYLQVIEQGEQTLLLGIGLDADPETGIQGNLKVSLFDVTELSSPREIDSFVFEGDFATSEALWEHKAVRYIASQNLLAIPTQVYDGNDFTNTYALTVFDIGGQTGIDRLGEVNQDGAWISRSLGIQNSLFAVSGEQISAHTFDNLALLSSVSWETTASNPREYVTWENAASVDVAQASLSVSSDFESDPTRLVESEGTVATLSISLDDLPPEAGTTVVVESPNLSEFDVGQIQITGGELGLSEAAETQLESILESKVTATVPGGAIATSSPLGSWSGAAGLANLETETPVNPDDRFEVGSVTKTFTATTLLKLVEAGILTLDDRLTDWLPEAVTANVPNASDITLRQLLNHTSGVPEYDFILLEQGMSNPFVFLQDWQPSAIVELIADLEPFFAPGEGWQYANTNFILAGMVIESATGNTLANEIQSKIIEPLALENTFFSTTKDTLPGGYISGYLDFDQNEILDDVSIANLSWAWAAGAMVSNTDDLTRYARALYAGDLLSEETKAEMFTLVDTGRGYEYGLGMMSFDTPELGQIVGHRGGSLGFNSNMWYASEDDFTYVELLNGRTEEALATDTIPAFQGGPIVDVGNISDDSQLNVTLIDQTAQVFLPVSNDGETEGEETVTFSLQSGADYTIDPQASSGLLTIIDSQDSTPMQLPDRVISALDDALDSNLPPEVPGAAVAILTPEGEWFGASGFSDLENQVPLQPDDRFEAGSITKTFVATTILQLVEEEQLTLSDTLTQWLPTEITDLVPNASEITIEQLLNHTSGITDYLDVFTAQAASNPTLFLNEWTSEQLVGFIDGVEPFFAPGTDWQYSNTNYILAGQVIEAVTGNSYGQEIRDRIIDPLDLENTFVFGEEEIPDGYINSYWDFNSDGTLDNLNIVNLSWTGSAGSIISNAEDLNDFFDGLLVDGALLEAETLEEMLDTIEVESPNYDTYGLGIGTLESRNRFWYVHRGQTLGFRSNLWYSPLEEITYIELLNGRSSSNLVSDLLPTYRRTIQPPTPDIITYEFEWTGQIAEFSVEGEFSYDAGQSFNFEEGIVREEDLESFDISFFDPDGNLLRTYEDNHLTFPEFNFAFDTNTKQILTDGIFTEPDGLNVGEKTAVGDGFTGLNLWSKSKETSSSLIHLDEWSRQLGFPIGYSTHEDIAFLTQTTAQLIETGKVGETYLDDIQDTLDELGSPIVVSLPANDEGAFKVVDGATSLFLDFTLFEVAGLVIQDATPTADPFSNQFQLAFNIEESTDFQFESVPFSPIGGTIDHTGDITFLVGGDALVSIGDFSIGFDAARVNETNSGFFVADTLEDGLGIDILFDVSAPERLLVDNNELTIADADLLLAPELANVLGLNDFVGADVGDTRIDAGLMELAPPTEAVVTVDFSTTNFVEELGTPFPGEVENPQALTVTFTVEGELADGVSPVLNFASSEPDGLTRFSLTELQTDGLLAVADVANFEFTDAEITLLEPTASFTIPLFNLPDDRDLDGDGIIEDFAGQTEMVDFTITSLTEGVTINPETEIFTGTFYETLADVPTDQQTGTEDEDRLLGTGGDDTLTALEGDDTVFGRAGNDAIDGGSEDDRLFGGDGNDTINGGSENDRIAGNAGDDILTGGSGNDRIFASSGTDILDGGSGDDRLFGGDDRDILIGNTGSDFLNGGAGDDVLMGVTGRDVLVGGEGADLFVFGVGDGKDLIRDFEVGIDKIALVEGELTFADITITQSGSRTLLGVASSGETLAVLKGVDALSIGESSFEVVPNVATVEEAMAIL